VVDADEWSGVDDPDTLRVQVADWLGRYANAGTRRTYALALGGVITTSASPGSGPPAADRRPTSTRSFSHHLKTLREAGLIRNEPAGRQRTITLRRAEVDERFPGLLDAVLS
jgi:hypothetical protein